MPRHYQQLWGTWGKRKNCDHDKSGQIITMKYPLLLIGGALGLQKSPSAQETANSFANTFFCISRGFSDTHSNPLESKELPSDGAVRSLDSSKWWIQVRGGWETSQRVAGAFTEQMPVIVWRKSIKVVACAFQMCREPSASSNESQFCLQLKGKSFYSQIAVTHEVLLKTRPPAKIPFPSPDRLETQQMICTVTFTSLVGTAELCPSQTPRGATEAQCGLGKPPVLMNRRQMIPCTPLCSCFSRP